MNRFNFRYNKQRMIVTTLVGLIFSIVTLTVVYASLSTTLNISGSSDVIAPKWDVHLANGQFTTSIPSINAGNGSPSPVNNVYDDYKVVPLATPEPVYGCSSGTDCINYMSGTSGSFYTAPLSKPGDFKAISFDVVNGGGIDAKLDGFVLNGISSAQDVYLNYYILYSDGYTPKSGDVLTAGSTKSMVLVIEFDEYVTSSQLPTTDQSLSLSFTLNYVQN